MNKKLLVALFAFMILFSGCNKDNVTKVPEIESLDVESDENFVEIIRSDILSEMNLDFIKYETKDGKGEEYNLIPAIVVDIVRLEVIDNTYNIYTNIIEKGYSFKNGIFESNTGALYPRKYELNEKLEVVNIVNARDGADFFDSILEMANNDKELAEKLSDSQNAYKVKYDELMHELKESAEEAGLENITHKIEEIPGYEKSLGMEYIQAENNPKGVISVINTEDYNELQERRKTIVPSDKAGVHWVYAPCVLYHEDTGICVMGLIDYYD